MKETIKKFIARQKQYYERQDSFGRLHYIIMAMLISVAIFFAIIFFIHIEYTTKIRAIGELFAEDITRAQVRYYKANKIFFSTGEEPVSFCPELGIDARKNIFFKTFRTNGDTQSYKIEVKNPHDTFGQLYEIITFSGTPELVFERKTVHVYKE